MPEHHHSKVLIIGAGPAGYTAAIYAARANLQPILVTGLQPGGQLTITTDVENYPGFAEIIQGPWLMEQMHTQAEHVGTRMILDMVAALDLGRRPFVATGDSGDLYFGETVILATGAQARWLGVPGEDAFRGFGVSACATCDGFFFRDKDVIIVGGGNTAVEEALYLTNHARRVTLVHRRNALRAEKILQDRLFRNPKIDMVWDSIVEEIVGVPEPPEVKGVILRNLRTGATRCAPRRSCRTGCSVTRGSRRYGTPWSRRSLASRSLPKSPASCCAMSAPARSMNSPATACLSRSATRR